MINNLKHADCKIIRRRAAVCIIGAGTGGIFLAECLRKNDVSVIMLEIGDESSKRSVDLGYQCLQSGLHYRGADHGRAFGLGGTSCLWGGQLISLTRSDFQSRPDVGIPAWPIAYDDMAKHIPTVMSALGVPIDDDDGERKYISQTFRKLESVADDFDLRLSHWIPFSNRNISKAFKSGLEDKNGVDVWLESGVISFKIEANTGYPRINGISAQATNGNRLEVEASIVVVAAGALESTRILLEIDEMSNGLLTKSGSPIGKYFSDHLSISCGKFICRDWRRFNLVTAPVFRRGIMRTPRLELNPTVQKKLKVTSAFAHFTFLTDGRTGFDLVRNFLRNRQGEQQSINLNASNLFRMISDIGSMTHWRVVHDRLWIPRTADVLLKVDIEQVPNRDSSISLDDERDGWGRKKIRLNWQITQDDIRVIKTVAERMKDLWNNESLQSMAELKLTLDEAFSSFESAYDVYHPTGCLRMGSNPVNSVVDSNLKVWSLDNLFVASTAVFPSAGSANPGLVHLALIKRLADHLQLMSKKI